MRLILDELASARTGNRVVLSNGSVRLLCTT